MKYIFILFASVLFINCSPKTTTNNIPYQRNGMVNCIEYDKMTITVISEGQAESKSKAITHAEVNAIENILFKGIPKSNQERPLVSNEEKAVRMNSNFFKEFIDYQGYTKYMTESLVHETFQQNGVHMVRQKITFDLMNMRNHLEQKKIIKSFGL